jgi:hypothetical protein
MRVDLLITVSAGENVVQEGSNMKAVLVMIYGLLWAQERKWYRREAA